VGAAVIRARDSLLVEKNRAAGSQYNPRWAGQTGEIQNILHETITGNRIVKAFGMENWEVARFRTAARRLFRANLRSVAAFAISSPLMDILGAIAIALLLLLGRDQITTAGLRRELSSHLIIAVFKLYDPVRKFAMFNNNFQQAVGASSEIFRFMDVEDEVREKPGRSAWANLSGRSASRTCPFLIPVSHGNIDDSPHLSFPIYSLFLFSS